MERLTWVLEGATSVGPALLTALLALGYGTAAALLVGARSWLLAISTGVPVGIALLAVSAQAAGMLGMQAPTGAHALVGLVVAAVVGVVAGRWKTAGATSTEEPHRIVWVGVALAAVVTFVVWAGGVGDHTLPPQTNDDIWHGYLTERLTHMPIIRADTVAPTQADTPKPVLFYQYGLHLVWATTHAVTGVSLASILNGGWIGHVGLLVVIGAAALAWRLFPARPWVAFWAAWVAPGVVVLPYLTNALLPYTASLAMIPGFLAALLTYLRGEQRLPATVPALAAVGIFLTHPSGAIVGAIVGALIAIEVLATRASRAEALGTLRRLSTVGLIAGVVAVPWLVAAGQRGLGDLGNVAEVDVPTALWSVATLGTPWTSPQPILAALVLVGIGATIATRRGVGLAAAWLTLSVLFVGTVTSLPAFAGLTQPWHGHWYRIAAALGLVVPVLAALGIVTIVAWIRPRGGPRSRAPLRVGAVASIALLVVVGTAYGAAQGQSIVRTAWHSSARVTQDDLTMFRELAALAGSDDRVFNSPRDGSSWMYALHEVIPMHPYIYRTPRWSWDLVNGVGRYVDPVVACARLAHEGASYAIVKEVTGDIPGLEAYDIAGFVDRHPALFTEVARSDSGVVYRIDEQALADCIAGGQRSAAELRSAAAEVSKIVSPRSRIASRSGWRM